MDPFIINRARALVGTRFRLHGREPETGLDCIGLALAAADCRAGVRDDYRLRGHAPGELISAALTAGFVPGEVQPGAIALIDCGHGQMHIAVLAADSHIHAHAGLGRVVETPGWPVGIKAALLPPAPAQR